MAGVILNDIGPVMEPRGWVRIKNYVKESPHSTLDRISCQRGQSVSLVSRPAIFDHQAPAFNVASLVQTSPVAGQPGPTLKYPIMGWPAAARAPRAAMQSRRQASLRIFFVRYGLPYDPRLGSFMQRRDDTTLPSPPQPVSTLDAELNDFGAQLAMVGGQAADRDG
jgi:hypothetical protein